MDELLEELGVSYDELYKIHTGHQINRESEDSDSSDDSSSPSESLKPPPYSFDEINRNLVIFEAQTHAGNNDNSNHPTISEKVSKKLSFYITDRYCFVCKKGEKRKGKHYRRPNHYKTVRKWLQKELTDVLGEVKLSNFFCEICNLGLSGNDSAQKHYESEDHKNRGKKFCLPCLRSIPEKDMPNHLKSKNHKNDGLENSSLLEPKLNLEQDALKNKCTTTVLDIKNENMESDDQENNNKWSIPSTECESVQGAQQLFDHISKASALNNKSVKNNGLIPVYMANKDPSNSNKHKTFQEFGPLANIIMDLLTSPYCYVCNTPANGTHYNLREHNKALEQWIENYTETFGFYVRNMDDLICFACHAIFPKKKYAEIHYESSGHKSKYRQFCNVCLKHLAGKSSEDHYKQTKHIIEEAKKNEQERKKRNLKGSQTTDASFSEMFVQNRKSSNLKIHGIDVNVIKDIIEDKIVVTAQCETIAKTLLELMTPTYCFLCNKSALKNNQGIFKHYTYQTHINELKELLHYKAKNCGFTQANYASLYCEACNELFLNLELAKQHYHTFQHQRTCDICKIQGPNFHFAPLMYTEEIREHKQLPYNETPESGKNENKKENGNMTADLENNKQMSEENVISPTKDHPGSIIAEKLKDMLSPTFCYICKKNVNMHIFNHHYLEKDHIMKLRNWLNNEINKSGVLIGQNIIYCEYCSLELGGTSEDLKHYDTVTHQLNTKTYCSVCLFRGTHNDFEQHILDKQHCDNLKKRHIKTSLRRPRKGNQQNTAWPKKLTQLITLKECKVCCVELQTTEKADFHYCSDRHNINVKKWLDHYNRFGDNDVNTGKENNEIFLCAFCDSSFCSERELNDHNNSHFPTLGGSNGNIYSKKSRTRNNDLKTILKPKKQLELSEGVTSDKPVVAITSQQSVTQNVDKNNYSSDSDTKLEAALVEQIHEDNIIQNEDFPKLCNEIRIELNKLINSVYFSKAVPLEQSLSFIKELNRQLTDAGRTYKSPSAQGKNMWEGFEIPCIKNQQLKRTETETAESVEATEKNILNSPSSSNIETNVPWLRKYSETKLSMELERLKLVVSNKFKIPTDLALKYVQHLNQLLEDSVDSGSREIDIDSIFEAQEDKSVDLEDPILQKNLQLKLDELNYILLIAKKLNIEVALDFITQFNVQLESLLQYQTDDTWYYLSD